MIRLACMTALWTLFGVASAADQDGGAVYRCPGPPVRYLGDISAEEAKAGNCRRIEAAPATIVSPERRETEPARKDPSRRRSGIFTGSSMLVTGDGHLLTNNHVVVGCDVLRASRPGMKPVTAVVVRTDKATDLAVVKISNVLGPIVSFRDAPARAGDQVLALGYPLSGLLASEVNVSTGSISALAGIGNDANMLQIQAPVQPGNSGGPLLDVGGAVIGVVVSQLDALAVARITGGIPQNVNFAIKAQVATAFLRASGVSPRTAEPLAAHFDAAAVAAQVRPSVFLLECHRLG